MGLRFSNKKIRDQLKSTRYKGYSEKYSGKSEKEGLRLGLFRSSDPVDTKITGLRQHFKNFLSMGELRGVEFALNRKPAHIKSIPTDMFVTYEKARKDFVALPYPDGVRLSLCKLDGMLILVSWVFDTVTTLPQCIALDPEKNGLGYLMDLKDDLSLECYLLDKSSNRRPVQKVLDEAKSTGLVNLVATDLMYHSRIDIKTMTYPRRSRWLVRYIQGSDRLKIPKPQSVTTKDKIRDVIKPAWCNGALLYHKTSDAIGFVLKRVGPLNAYIVDCKEDVDTVRLSLSIQLKDRKVRKFHHIADTNVPDRFLNRLCKKDDTGVYRLKKDRMYTPIRICGRLVDYNTKMFKSGSTLILNVDKRYRSQMSKIERVTYDLRNLFYNPDRLSYLHLKACKKGRVK